jgi:hypothetical protein
VLSYADLFEHHPSGCGDLNPNSIRDPILFLVTLIQNRIFFLNALVTVKVNSMAIASVLEIFGVTQIVSLTLIAIVSDVTGSVT